MATKRIHPEIQVEELKKKYRVRFYHYLQFAEPEKRWLKDIIRQYAGMQGVQARSIYINREWVWFEVPR